MPWIRAILHGQKVYARATPEGALLVDGSRVEICYKLHAAKLYKARASNVTVESTELLPDDALKPQPAAAAASTTPLGMTAVRTAKRKRTGAAKGSASGGTPAVPAHPEGAIIAYADGACSGNPGPAGLGVVVLDGTTRTEISESIGIGTNNIAELSAIGRALDAVEDPRRTLVIYTDSGYAIGVLSKGWKAKANTALIEGLKKRLATRKDTRFVYVPGHAGVPLNERADELAREAVKTGENRRETLKG